MLSTVVLSNENQTCRGWEAPTSIGGGGCHQLIRDGVSDMHCMSDAYLAEELKQEYAEKNAG